MNGEELTSSAPSPTVTFQVTVQNQTYLVNTSDPSLIEEARQQISFIPISQRQHVIGSIVTGSHGNKGWTWHLENWKFFGMASEACDGLPSMVQLDVQNWIQTHANGTFCPWSSYVSECASANCANLPPIKPQSSEYLVTFNMNSTALQRKAVVSLIIRHGGKVIKAFINGTIVDTIMPMSLSKTVKEEQGVEAVEYQGRGTSKHQGTPYR